MEGVDEIGYGRAGPLDRGVHLPGARVRASSLDVARREVIDDGVERALGHLGAGGVIEEYEPVALVQRGKLGPDSVDREHMVTSAHQVSCES
jgi:hypothetical protein